MCDDTYNFAVLSKQQRPANLTLKSIERLFSELHVWRQRSEDERSCRKASSACTLLSLFGMWRTMMSSQQGCRSQILAGSRNVNPPTANSPVGGRMIPASVVWLPSTQSSPLGSSNRSLQALELIDLALEIVEHVPNLELPNTSDKRRSSPRSRDDCRQQWDSWNQQAKKGPQIFFFQESLFLFDALLWAAARRNKWMFSLVCLLWACLSFQTDCHFWILGFCWLLGQDTPNYWNLLFGVSFFALFRFGGRNKIMIR